jgi:outer membrane biosynthesis protein TonB
MGKKAATKEVDEPPKKHKKSASVAADSVAANSDASTGLAGDTDRSSQTSSEVDVSRGNQTKMLNYMKYRAPFDELAKDALQTYTSLARDEKREFLQDC